MKEIYKISKNGASLSIPLKTPGINRGDIVDIDIWKIDLPKLKIQKITKIKIRKMVVAVSMNIGINLSKKTMGESGIKEGDYVICEIEKQE